MYTNDHTTNTVSEVPVLLLRAEEAALRLGVGRTSMYRLIGSGEVESIQVGCLRRIPLPCLEEYVNRLRREQHFSPHADPGA